MQKFFNLNKAVKLVVVFIAIILILVLILLLYRMYRQNEITSLSNKIIDNSGFSELRKIDLNGSEQYIYIEAADKSKPIVLFLHGGPGAPYPFGANSRGLYPKISQNAVAIYWDQRGTGKSFNKSITADELTVEQFVADTNSLVDYLVKEFDRDKIYIVGVSWGTIPALKVVEQNPQKFYAYFAYAQLVNMSQAEIQAYEWMLNTIENKKSLEKLKEIGSPPYSSKQDIEAFSNILMNDSEAANKKIDGKNSANMLKLLSGVLFSPDYTLSDIWNTMVSANDLNMNQSNLPSEMRKIDFNEEIKVIDVPIYFIHGKHDMIVPFDITFDYYNQLNAPYKDFKVLDKSSHLPSDKDFEIVIDHINSIIK